MMRFGLYRMSKKFGLLLTLSLAFFSGFTQVTNRVTSKSTNVKHEFTYTNPITRDTAISMRDHRILKVKDKWYCVGTSEPVWTGPNPGVRLLVSDDLIHWKQHSWLIDAKKLPAKREYN